MCQCYLHYKALMIGDACLKHPGKKASLIFNEMNYLVVSSTSLPRLYGMRTVHVTRCLPYDTLFGNGAVLRWKLAHLPADIFPAGRDETQQCCFLQHCLCR